MRNVDFFYGRPDAVTSEPEAPERLRRPAEESVHGRATIWRQLLRAYVAAHTAVPEHSSWLCFAPPGSWRAFAFSLSGISQQGGMDLSSMEGQPAAHVLIKLQKLFGALRKITCRAH